MAGVSDQNFDAERTVVVLKYPLNVGEGELTAHFQKAKHGGGDVDGVLIHGNVAFVTFDMPEGLLRFIFLLRKTTVFALRLNLNIFLCFP